MLRRLIPAIVIINAVLTSPGPAAGQVPTMGVFVSGEFRINDPAGPDADPNSADDDFWDGDDSGPPPILMYQLSPAVAVLPALEVEGLPLLLSGWTDQSWRQYPGVSSGRPTVGIGFSQIATASPWTHDLARSINGQAGAGHLPPPPAYDPNGVNLDFGWLNTQGSARAAVGGNGYAYIVGENVDLGSSASESIFLGRTSDGTTWEMATVVATDETFTELFFPHVAAGRKGTYEDHVYVTWVRERYDEHEALTSYSIWFAESRDGGLIFSAPQRVTGDLPALSSPTPTPTVASAVGPDGSVYVVWYHPSATFEDGGGYVTDNVWTECNRLLPGTPPDTFEVRRFIPDLTLGSQPGDGKWSPDPSDFPDSVIAAEFRPLKLGDFAFQPSVSNFHNDYLIDYPSLVVDHTNTERRGWAYLAFAGEVGLDPDHPYFECLDDPEIRFFRLKPSAIGSWVDRTPDPADVGEWKFRSGHAMAYDSLRSQTVSHGGLGSDVNAPGGATIQRETRVWQGTWVNAFEGSDPLRYHHAMAYDLAPGRRVAVMFGGLDDVNAVRGDTYEWLGDQWALASAGGGMDDPPARYEHAMAYDKANGVVVMFGGADSSNALLGDTWTWDGVAWDLAATTGPTARWKHAMAYDLVNERLIMFGGQDPNGMCSDVWEWTGTAWTSLTPGGASAPSARADYAMAYDAAWERFVLFGGRNSSNAALEDTWLLKLNDAGTNYEWEELPLGAPHPSARWGHAMAFSGREGVLLFAGRDEDELFRDVWEWQSSRWEDRGSVNDPQAPETEIPSHVQDTYWNWGATTQFMPAIAMNDLGHLGVSWLDRRDDTLSLGADPNSNNPYDDDVVRNQAYRAYFAWSADGGGSWSDNIPLSSSVDPRAYTQGEPGYQSPADPLWSDTEVTLGFYRAMAGAGRGFLPVWISLSAWPGLENPPAHDPYYTLYGSEIGQQIGDVYASVIDVVQPVDGSADLDLDCDVDLSDFSLFGQCFGGSLNPPAPGCPAGVDADLDDDGDVDLSDFPILAQQFHGAVVPPCGSLMEYGAMQAMGPGIGGSGDDIITIGLDDSIGPNPNEHTYPSSSGATISYEVYVAINPLLNGRNSQGLAGLVIDILTDTGHAPTVVTYSATSDAQQPATVVDDTWQSGQSLSGGFGLGFLSSTGTIAGDDLYGAGAVMPLTWDADVAHGHSGLQPAALHNVGFGDPPGTDVGGATVPPSDERARWYLFAGEIPVPDEVGSYTVSVNVRSVLLIAEDAVLSSDVSDGYLVEAIANGDDVTGGSFMFDVVDE